MLGLLGGGGGGGGEALGAFVGVGVGAGATAAGWHTQELCQVHPDSALTASKNTIVRIMLCCMLVIIDATASVCLVNQAGAGKWATHCRRCAGR